MSLAITFMFRKLHHNCNRLSRAYLGDEWARPTKLCSREWKLRWSGFPCRRKKYFQKRFSTDNNIEHKSASRDSRLSAQVQRMHNGTCMPLLILRTEKAFLLLLTLRFDGFAALTTIVWAHWDMKSLAAARRKKAGALICALIMTQRKECVVWCIVPNVKQSHKKLGRVTIRSERNWIAN